MLKSLKGILKSLLLLTGCLFLLLFFYLFFHLVSDPKLRTERYSLRADVENTMRIVLISDLHNTEIDKENRSVIEEIKAMEPDLIVMAGDMINRDDPDTSVIENLVSDLSKDCPVYYGYGNHEFYWDQETGPELHTTIREIVTSCGGQVLDRDYQDLRVKGNHLRLGGYMGYYHFPGMLEEDREKWVEDIAFFDSFEDTNDYKILINHIPTQWIDWDHLNDFDVDLVLSGHYHGGQWVLPVIGPVFAPYVQWFPDHVKGVFTGEKGSLVLTTGLGNEYTLIPRVNNPPEIVLVELEPEG